jgi:hypothetical protein
LQKDILKVHILSECNVSAAKVIILCLYTNDT